MSYDTYLHPPKKICEHCKREFETVSGPDPTYNLTPIFDLALTGEDDLPDKDVSEGEVVLLGRKTMRPRGLRLLDGKLAKDTIEMLDKAIERLEDPSLLPKFRALEPANKWGDLDGAVYVVKKLRTLAGDHLDHRWEVH